LKPSRRPRGRPGPAQAGRTKGPSRIASGLGTAGTRGSSCSPAARRLPPLRPAPAPADRTGRDAGGSPPPPSHRIAALAGAHHRVSVP
jgi:hypothetical protein